MNDYFMRGLLEEWKQERIKPINKRFKQKFHHRIKGLIHW